MRKILSSGYFSLSPHSTPSFIHDANKAEKIFDLRRAHYISSTRVTLLLFNKPRAHYIDVTDIYYHQSLFDFITPNIIIIISLLRAHFH